MQEENNSIWINTTDIMSALMMVFMFISIAFLYQLKDENEKPIKTELIKKEKKKIISKKELYRIQLNKDLNKEFSNDLDGWKAEITKNNIFRFNSPFKKGSSMLPNNFAIILEDFFPRYIKILTLTKFKNEISEVRVEGHTSYGWGVSSSDRENYLNNMSLSQKRANNVLSYVYSINNNLVAGNREWLEKYLRANGMAFSNQIYTNKKKSVVNNTRSRRVEFRVVTRELLSTL